MDLTLTLKQARAILRPLGITITKAYGDEYRCNPVNGSEGTAYYTDDLGDAVGTGRAMAAHVLSGSQQ